MAELALEPTLDFGDYLAAFRRRRGMVTLIALGVFILGLIVAYLWPPTYRASATILIEEQEIPVELIQSTVTSYAAQRIQVINQRVMTRANLLEIIEKYTLYEKERQRDTTETILEEMREDILIDMVTAEVMDPRTGRPTAATIAFTVGFEGENPQLVQRVASELTSLYLNENLKTRTEKSAETFNFITEEAQRYKDEISRLEAEIVEFNKKNIDVLPENKGLNTSSLERTERELDATERELRSLQESAIYLEGQLAMMEPNISSPREVYSPEMRLEALRTEYISLFTRYSPDHPDVVRTKNEIAALEKETGVMDFTAERIQQLEALRAELALAEERYSELHPDVQNLRRQIDALEEEFRNQPRKPELSLSSQGPSNPAYVNLMTQLYQNKSSIESLRKRRADLEEKRAEYELRLLLTPQVESEYRNLVRDYEHASGRYEVIKAKEMTAEVAQELEKERKGEKFTLIDPAILPEEPVSPNRPAIIFLSLVLALGSGIGAAAVAESLDSAVRGAKGLVGLLNTAPLAVIPYLDTAVDKRKKGTRRAVLILVVIAAIVTILALIHFLVSPLDVFWFRGLRKLESLTGGMVGG